jgi:hypothetical protein
MRSSLYEQRGARCSVCSEAVMPGDGVSPSQFLLLHFGPCLRWWLGLTPPERTRIVRRAREESEWPPEPVPVRRPRPDGQG